MTATNHALTGAVIGLSLHNPWLAIPAAVLSHMVCDAIPHFGIEDPDWIGTKVFKTYLLVEATVCGLIVGALYLSGSPHWLLAAVCAFAAASPDFLSIGAFRAAQNRRTVHRNRLQSFLKRIQWYEKPPGAVIELLWAAGCITLLSRLV